MMIPDDDCSILKKSILNAVRELEALKLIHDKKMEESDAELVSEGLSAVAWELNTTLERGVEYHSDEYAYIAESRKECDGS